MTLYMLICYSYENCLQDVPVGFVAMNIPASRFTSRRNANGRRDFKQNNEHYVLSAVVFYQLTCSNRYEFRNVLFFSSP